MSKLEYLKEIGVVSKYNEYDIQKIHIIYNSFDNVVEGEQMPDEDYLHYLLRGEYDLICDGVKLTPAVLKDFEETDIIDICECGGSFYENSEGLGICDKCKCLHEDYY